jgi:hypothetical protein
VGESSRCRLAIHARAVAANVKLASDVRMLTAQLLDAKQAAIMARTDPCRTLEMQTIASALLGCMDAQLQALDRITAPLDSFSSDAWQLVHFAARDPLSAAIATHPAVTAELAELSGSQSRVGQVDFALLVVGESEAAARSLLRPPPARSATARWSAVRRLVRHGGWRQAPPWLDAMAPRDRRLLPAQMDPDLVTARDLEVMEHLAAGLAESSRSWRDGDHRSPVDPTARLAHLHDVVRQVLRPPKSRGPASGAAAPTDGLVEREVQMVDLLSRISAERLLLIWLNFQLSRSIADADPALRCTRRVVGYYDDLRDGEVWTALMRQVGASRLQPPFRR